MKIMQKKIVSLICTMALLAFLMPATIAEDSQNATANITMNGTQNLTGNITLNATENVTASVAPVEIHNAPEVISKNDGQEAAPTATQMGAQNAARHNTVLRAGFEKTKPLNNLDVYGNKSTHNINTSYKPIYNVSQYTRTKPIYEVPDTLTSKPVYGISGYPIIKAVNSIP